MELLRFATAGSVDDGKSTLIGRLLYDSKAIFEDQLEAVERLSRQRGDEYTDLALLTDGLRAEREQGITIDVAYRYFATPLRKFIIADTPGHIQYTRNMVTGNSTADLTLVLVDARKGIVEQTRRHAFLASLLRVPHLLLCVNKMDLVDYDQAVFARIREEFKAFATRLEVADLAFIPISALNGDNVVQRSPNMAWYEGPSLLHHLEQVYIASDRNLIDPRLPVQWVVRPTASTIPDYRGYAGRVAGGVFRPGDEVMVLPSGLTTTIAAIDTFDGPVDEAFAPMSVMVRLAEDLDVSRGDMHLPAPQPAHRWARTSTPWCAGWPTGPCSRGRRPRPQAHHPLGAGPGAGRALPPRRQHPAPRRLGRHAEAQRGGPGEPAGDPAALLRQLPAQPDHGVVHPGGRGHQRHRRRRHDPRGRTDHGAGLGPRVVAWAASRREDRWETPRAPRGATVWFTGLSGSGKSTLAAAVEERLVASGRPAYRLDGDNIRSGLNVDLGFDPRAARRTSAGWPRWPCCSPTPASSPWPPSSAPTPRPGAGPGPCTRTAGCPSSRSTWPPRSRCAPSGDPKGLYARASAGDITSFTGLDHPYEPPTEPDVVVGHHLPLSDAVERVLEALGAADRPDPHQT